MTQRSRRDLLPAGKRSARALHFEHAMSGLRRWAIVLLASFVASFGASFGASSAGCGGETPTSVTQLWKAPVAAAPLKTVIVFAAQIDEANRRSLEDSYAEALRRRGLTATPSYTIFPGEPPARQAVKAAGFDGILVSMMRSFREPPTYVPGWYEGGFWHSYYGPGWDYWSPGYVISDPIVSFDTTLWDTRIDDQLVFAITTETNNPTSSMDFVESLPTTVGSALDKQRLIPPAR